MSLPLPLAVLLVAERLGSDGQGTGGAVGYLRNAASLFPDPCDDPNWRLEVLRGTISSSVKGFYADLIRGWRFVDEQGEPFCFRHPYVVQLAAEALVEAHLRTWHLVPWGDRHPRDPSLHPERYVAYLPMRSLFDDSDPRNRDLAFEDSVARLKKAVPSHVVDGGDASQ